MSIEQLGVDRVVDMQFGSGEVAHHLIVEIYDRGNVILTDHKYTILQLLRNRTDKEAELRFHKDEQYPLESVRQQKPPPSVEQ